MTPEHEKHLAAKYGTEAAEHLKNMAENLHEGHLVTAAVENVKGYVDAQRHAVCQLVKSHKRATHNFVDYVTKPFGASKGNAR